MIPMIIQPEISGESLYLIGNQSRFICTSRFH